MSVTGWSILVGTILPILILAGVLFFKLIPRLLKGKDNGVTEEKKPKAKKWPIGNLIPHVAVIVLVCSGLLLVRAFGSGFDYDVSWIGPLLLFPTVVYWFTRTFGNLPEDRSPLSAQRAALATLLLVVLWFFKAELSFAVVTFGLSASQHITSSTMKNTLAILLSLASLVVLYNGVLNGKVYQNVMAANVLFVLWVMLIT